MGPFQVRRTGYELPNGDVVLRFKLELIQGSSEIGLGQEEIVVHTDVISPDQVRNSVIEMVNGMSQQLSADEAANAFKQAIAVLVVSVALLPVGAAAGGLSKAAAAENAGLATNAASFTINSGLAAFGAYGIGQTFSNAVDNYSIGRNEDATLQVVAGVLGLAALAASFFDPTASQAKDNAPPGAGSKASAWVKWAEDQGWTRTQTPDGPIKYVDENGVVRLTIKKGSPRTPGSNAPHVEIRDPTGRRVDPAGNPVLRRSPDNHTPIDWDLHK